MSPLQQRHGHNLKCAKGFSCILRELCSLMQATQRLGDLHRQMYLRLR